MRVVPVLGSVAAHAAVLALIAPWFIRDRELVSADRAPTAAVEPVPDASDPLEVAVVIEPGDGGGPVGPAPRLAAFGVSPARVAHSAAAGETAQPATGVEPAIGGKPAPHGSLYMHMRGPELHLSEAEADRMLDHPEAPPPPVLRSGRLESAPGGRGVVYDATTTIDVERDGTAHMRRVADIDGVLHVPLPSFDTIRDPERGLHRFGKEVGDWLEDWYADPYKQMRKGSPTDLPEQLKVVQGQCDQWGTPGCEPEPPQLKGNVVELRGRFDLTSFLERKLGVGDVYSSRKRALLDATFAERVEQGGVYRAGQLERSVQLVRANLQQLWRTTTDPAARRAALFELWDECAEGEGPQGEAGERARAQVIAWIHTYLPPGSPGAFTASEIARLSAVRTSKQAFAP